jgi:sulfide:quinone oxidoreductase
MNGGTPARALHVVIAGGGVAGLETMLALHALAQDRVSIALIVPEPRFWYRPLSVGEPFGVARARHFELSEAAEACGACLTLDSVASVDPEERLARTGYGAELPYDALVLAPGARPEPAFADGLTFRGPADAEAFARLLRTLEDTPSRRRLLFAVPAGVTWPLPLYELALMTARSLRAARRPVELALVSPESEPLALFGARASAAVSELLSELGIAFVAGRSAVAAAHGALALDSGEPLEYDHLVALPRLRGQPIAGIPHDRHGFVPTDEAGRVAELADVYAAGDITTFPVKQGGIAAQQADAVAEAIAADAGALLDPRPFRPVLRGLLLTGNRPAFLRTDLSAENGSVNTEPLWWPPGKIVGRYLSPFLAERAGVAGWREANPPAGAIEVDVDLGTHAARRSSRSASASSSSRPAS